MGPNTTKDRGICRFCSNKVTAHSGMFNAYVCFKGYNFCDGLKEIIKHLETCELCKDVYKSTEGQKIYYRLQSKHYRHCETFKYLLMKRRKDPNNELTTKQIENQKIRSILQKGGDHPYKCEKCGEKAKYLLFGQRLSCSPKLKECPKFHDDLSKKFKEQRGTVEYRQMMSEAMKEAQNRPEVKEKKRQTMLYLHNDNEKECLVFRHNYTKAQVNRRGKKYPRNEYYRIRSRENRGEE